MKRFIACLANLDAWIGTAVHCLSMRKIREEQRQKMFADTSSLTVLLFLQQLIWNIAFFVKYRARAEMASGGSSRPSKIVMLSSTDENVLNV